MSGLSTTRDYPGSALADQGVVHTVIPIFFLAFLIPGRGLDQILPGFPALPLNSIGAILLIMLAAFRNARWQIALPWFTLAAGGLVASLLVSSAILQPDFDVRRAGNYAIVLGLAFVVASGRLHLDSLRRGLLVGLVFGTAASFVQMRLGDTGYSGRLSGVLGDPNGAGFALVALGFVIAQGMRRQRDLWLLWIFLAGAIWLTQSRTSMFAFAVATLWVFFGRRLGRVLGLAALVGTLWAFQWVTDYAERQGWFTERLGSDDLRDRLAGAEELLVESAGWWGHGLGSALAEFDGITLFFHNSYRALQTEGGVIAITFLILMGVSLFWAFYKIPTDRRPVWAEAAVIAACICSINIGYSLTGVNMAMTVGMYLAYHCLVRQEVAGEDAFRPEPVRSGL